MDVLYDAVVVTALFVGFIILLALADAVVHIAARLMRWYDG